MNAGRIPEMYGAVDVLEIALVARRMRRGVEVKDRTFFFATYEKCFEGEQAVAWMLSDRSIHQPFAHQVKYNKIKRCCRIDLCINHVNIK
jgi:hypothetical protein